MTMITWQLVSQLYQTAQKFFGKYDNGKNAGKFLSTLSLVTKSNHCAVVVNINNQKLICVDSQNNRSQLEYSDLIDILPLLFQSYACTRLSGDRAQQLFDMMGLQTPTSVVDGAFFAFETNENMNESVFIILFRDADTGPFADDEYQSIERVENFMTELVSMSIINAHGEQLSVKLSEQKKAQSIWLESLAWINQASIAELNRDQLQDFYSTAIFQMKMLVLADSATAFSVLPSLSDIKCLVSHEMSGFTGFCEKIIKDEFGLENFHKGRHRKLQREQNWLINQTDYREIMIFPLFVEKEMRMLLCVGSKSKCFDSHEEKVAILFAEGLEHIVERNEFLVSIKEQNQALQAERSEQQILINKLQEAQDQLLQQEKMASIGQLAAGVAHEINNPVGYVNSNINTMGNYVNDLYDVLDLYGKLESFVTEENETVQALHQLKNQIDFDFIREDIQSLINESKEGVLRVKNIVKDLKDFSHVDEAEWQWADIEKGIKSTLNIVHNELKYTATIIEEYQPLPMVECVPSQINQILMNLLVNAGHAIENKGTITLKTWQEGESVCISVSDTGKGIPPENISKIFNPFFTTKPVGKGTGLGLSLSYSIAERHGGEISVSSQVGVGTTFKLTLPIKQVENKAEGEVQA